MGYKYIRLLKFRNTTHIISLEMSRKNLGYNKQQFCRFQFGKIINGYRSSPMGNQNIVFASFETYVEKFKSL